MFLYIFFFFKQKTAYEMRISDWSSDVCSSDLISTASILRHGLASVHLFHRVERSPTVAVIGQKVPDVARDHVHSGAGEKEGPESGTGGHFEYRLTDVNYRPDRLVTWQAKAEFPNDLGTIRTGHRPHRVAFMKTQACTGFGQSGSLPSAGRP